MIDLAQGLDPPIDRKVDLVTGTIRKDLEDLGQDLKF